MGYHQNARLTAHSREQLARKVVDEVSTAQRYLGKISGPGSAR